VSKVSHWSDKSVVCPFYQRCESNRICCEGLTKDSTINLVFEDPNKKIEYKRNYCYRIGQYPKCPISEVLNRKYEAKS
jgi:hypothetical protein